MLPRTPCTSPRASSDRAQSPSWLHLEASDRSLARAATCVSSIRYINTDGGRLSCPIHSHNVTGIERRRAPRTLLADFHFRRLSMTDNCTFHRVRANGTVNERLRLVCYWIVNLFSHCVLLSSLSKTQTKDQTIAKSML